MELSKYAGSALTFFSIGNYLELAEKIKIAEKNYPHAAIQDYTQKFNMDTNAKFYADVFEETFSR